MGPNSPQVAIGAVCVRNGRVLLIRRGRGLAVGRWSVPGGRLEPGESLHDAVLRELHEETGLRGRVSGLCGIVERVGADHHYVILDYWVEVSGGQARPGDDATAVAWASRDELGRLDLVDGLWDFLDEHGVLAALGP